MRGIWQAATILFISMAMVLVADEPPKFDWQPLKITRSIFTRDLGMLDPERDEYATNLSDHAISQLAASKANPAALADARRMLALALNLSPRNKRALVAGFQLGRGVLPEAVDGAYSPQAFARLLHARALLLQKQDGDDNRLLARMFIELAAGMDPKNDDAVYASEVQRLDHGELDWSAVTHPKEEKR
jgi:hypothetical protein